MSRKCQIDFIKFFCSLSFFLSTWPCSQSNYVFNWILSLSRSLVLSFSRSLALSPPSLPFSLNLNLSLFSESSSQSLPRLLEASLSLSLSLSVSPFSLSQFIPSVLTLSSSLSHSLAIFLFFSLSICLSFSFFLRPAWHLPLIGTFRPKRKLVNFFSLPNKNDQRIRLSNLRTSDLQTLFLYNNLILFSIGVDYMHPDLIRNYVSNFLAVTQ